MNRRALVCPLLLALAALPAPARAQHGELQLGLAVSHGSAAAFGVGVGPVAGIALGRLAYVGARWLHQRGSTTSVESSSTGVTTRAELFTVDLGVIVPVRGLEVAPGVSIGAARFVQRGGEEVRATELVVAPGIAVHVYVGGLVLIPEFQYSLTGRPDASPGFENRGRLASFRVAVPIELGRIRQ